MTQIILSNRYVEIEQPGENPTPRSAASLNAALASNVTLVSTRLQYRVQPFFLRNRDLWAFVAICWKAD